LEGHFRAVAAATDLPVMIYDIPIRTGRKISTATLLRLARDVPNLLALKDAAGNPGETAALISSAPDGFEVYSGDDAMTLPLLACGAVGVVGVATHWTGPDHQEMFELWDKGDLIGARIVHSRMLPSFAYETGDDAPNPIPTKALLRVLGLPVGQARLPMGPAPDGLEDRAREVLADLERWREAFPYRPDRLSA
jgi:4-hydroxy-tetrahydrodipicolinate synthase